MIPSGRLGCKWEEGIKINLREICFDDVNSNELIQERAQFVTAVVTIGVK
jgi:hypothetical protein